MGDIDIVHSDPQQAGRKLVHQLPGNVDRKLIRTAQAARVGRKIGDGDFEHLRYLVQLLIAHR